MAQERAQKEILINVIARRLALTMVPTKQSIWRLSKFASSLARIRSKALLDPASLKQLKGKLESTLWVAMTSIVISFLALIRAPNTKNQKSSLRGGQR
jgi:hypothetical protein